MAKKVFISYSHDSDAHRERVLALSERLRADGIETMLDRYVNGSPRGGWPRWMLDQLDAADAVLVVCTETYYRRFRGHEERGTGKGVDWEGALITQELYDSHSQSSKFVPVYFDANGARWIPEPLRAGTRYELTSEKAYSDLYDVLLGQSGVAPGPVGTLKRKPRARGRKMTFAAAPETPLSTDPHDDVVDIYGDALRALADEDYPRALEGLSRAIELDPTLERAFYNRGLTYYYLNDLRAAIQDFDRAQTLGFHDVLLYRNRGNAFSRKGDVRRALDDYAQAIALEPENPGVYLNRGQVYANTLQNDLAIADYQTVLRLVADPQLHAMARARLLELGVRVSSSPALDLWKEKLVFLQTEEVKAVDAAQKFSIQQQIKEAMTKIRELEGGGV